MTDEHDSTAPAGPSAGPDGGVAAELAAMFARHEGEVPAEGPLRERLGGLVRRRHRRRTVRGAGTAIAVLAVLLALPALVPAVRSALPGGRTVTAATGASRDYLLLGTDQRSPDAVGRPDTIMIAHLPADGRHAYLVSLPRDTLVHHTSCGPISTLSCAFTNGGATAEAAAVTSLTGIRFDGVLVVRFAGLARVVDALGGVTMCVDEDTPTQFPPYTTFTKGCQHFDGATALDYVRQRENIPDGDFGRQRHVQQLLAAVLATAAGSGSGGRTLDPARLTRLLAAAGDAVTVDAGGASLTELAGQLSDRYRRLGPGAGALVGLHLPEQNLYQNGTAYEGTGSVGAALFRALRTDQLAAFARANPTLVNRLR
jgi:LCP family protein required for cell wall assembly